MDATSPDTDSAELSAARDFEPFLREMVIVRQDFGDSQAAHRSHRHAVHKAVALVRALFTQSQPRQERFARLRINSDALVVLYPANRPSGCLAPIRTRAEPSRPKALSGFRPW